MEKISWVLYDWANSGYGLVIIGPVFTHFFINTLLPGLPGAAGGHGLVFGGTVFPASAVMGLLNSLSMLLMALGAPVLGAIADIRGWTKRLLIISAATGSVCTLLMYFLAPGDWVLGAILFVVSNVCFGTSFTFYNAYLPRLAPPERQGRLSGWGFAVGYVGGALALIMALVVMRAESRGVPIALALSGAWWLLFSLPAFFFLKEFEAQDSGASSVVAAGFRRVGATFRNVRRYRMLFLFLLAFLLYNDAVETVISMSPSFAAEVLKMSGEDLIRIFLLVQFVAFLGAVCFGYLADRVGNKPVILVNLGIWLGAIVGAYFVTNGRQFGIAAIAIGVVLGGVQASSRSLMASLAPEGIQNEAFGFFSISGKFASILGPLAYAGLATAFTPRAGVLSVVPFLVLGFLLLLKVQEPSRTAAFEPSSREAR